MQSGLGRFFKWLDFAKPLPVLTGFAGNVGQYIGQDEFGNKYYMSKAKASKKRRWVIYNGYADSSKVPAKWHSWLHGVVDEIPSEQERSDKKWMKSHLPNLTGSDSAYRPSGSLSKKIVIDEQKGNYESWSP